MGTATGEQLELTGAEVGTLLVAGVLEGLVGHTGRRARRRRALNWRSASGSCSSVTRGSSDTPTWASLRPYTVYPGAMPERAAGLRSHHFHASFVANLYRIAVERLRTPDKAFDAAGPAQSREGLTYGPGPWESASEGESRQTRPSPVGGRISLSKPTIQGGRLGARERWLTTSRVLLAIDGASSHALTSLGRKLHPTPLHGGNYERLGI